MRKATILLAFVALMCLTMATTCKPRQTYNTLSTVRATTDSSVAAFFDLVVKGQVKTNNVPQVSMAYDMFNAVFSTAVDFARGNSNAVATEMVTSASAEVLNHIAVAKAVK
jgi:hypothetical protein